MTANPVTVRPSDFLWKAEHLMAERLIRHLPVVNAAGMVVGMLTQRDLLKRGFSKLRHCDDGEVRRYIEQTRVEEIMSPMVHVVRPTDPIATAGNMMLVHKYGSLPVVEGRKLVGILTESDFLRYVVEHAGAPTQLDFRD